MTHFMTKRQAKVGLGQFGSKQQSVAIWVRMAGGWGLVGLGDGD